MSGTIELRRPTSRPEDAATRSLVARRGWVVDALLVLVSGLLPLPRGADIEWDLISYHYLYPWLMFHGGIGQVDPEPFANRYVNPLAELPWFLLNHFLGPLGSTFAIAAFAGINLVLVRRIAMSLFAPRFGSRAAFLLALAAAVLGGVGTIFRTELGMSLSDVVVSVPMLAALLCVVLAARPGQEEWRGRLLLAAGALSGVAVGTKLTMAPYTVALAVAVVYLAIRARRPAGILLHAAGGLAGVAASAGWWFYSVWKVTGSPVFPYYNNVFHSPYWPDTSLRDPRFGTRGLVDAIKYPWYVAHGTHRLLDVRIQDPRWLVLCLVLALCLVVAAVLRSRGRRPLPLGLPAHVLMIFFVISALLWLKVFAIARYAVTNEVLAGLVMLVAAVWVVGRARPVAVTGLALAVLLVPFTHIGHYEHTSFGSSRFKVHSKPLKAVTPGSVVIADPASGGPSGFLLTYLRPGVKRHVIMPWFQGTPMLAKLQREQLVNAPHIYLLEAKPHEPGNTARVRDEMGLAVEPAQCVAIKSAVKHRYLCPARWVGPVTTPASFHRPGTPAAKR